MKEEENTFNNQLYLVILWNFLIDQTTDFKNMQLKINVKYNLTFRDNTSFSEQRTIIIICTVVYKIQRYETFLLEEKIIFNAFI